MVQDFLHPQSLVSVVALGYNESLEDFSSFLSSERYPLLHSERSINAHVTQQSLQLVHADVS